MLSLLLAVTLATTQRDLVRYAATKGVTVVTKTPDAVVTVEQERRFKSWVGGVIGEPFHTSHPRRHRRHHSTSEPD